MRKVRRSENAGGFHKWYSEQNTLFTDMTNYKLVQKISIFVFTCFCLFVTSQDKLAIVYATRGCCSGHGGVNCGAGAQANGAVICGDGSTGSSCQYSAMVECGG